MFTGSSAQICFGIKPHTVPPPCNHATARAHCQQLGGDLASIHSEADNVEAYVLIWGAERAHIGLTHFFTKSEYKKLLKGCSIINPCESVYELPKVEANRRGYDHYKHAMWIVYAVK